jgi:hypothetical protein
MNHLQDLDRRLDTALTRLGAPPGNAVPASKLGPGQVELFAGCVLLTNGEIALRGPDNRWIYTDGKQIRSSDPGAGPRPCPPPLSAALRSVLLKLQKEFASDAASLGNDLRDLASDRRSLENDLSEYNRLKTANGYDGNYAVDYGTEEIPVDEALRRTERDIDQNGRDTEQTQTQREQRMADQQTITTALPQFHP